MSRPLTTRVSKKRPGWIWALTGSFWLHTALIGALVGLGSRDARPAPETIVIELASPPPELPSEPSGGTPSLQELPDPPLAAHDEAQVPRPLDAAEGDRDNAVAQTVAPRDADGRDRAKPAPDQGIDGGHLRERAFRRDRSTLRSRLTDGAAESQPSRLRTAARTASPQAIRREARTGIGDSIRPADPTRAASAAQPDTPPAPEGDAAGPPAGSKLAARMQRLEIAHASDTPSPERGVGALAAETGARMFDTEVRGRAADSQTLRAASSEEHPGITDFSHAGVAAPTDSLQGRGPGHAPGAIALVTNGTAPAEYGARDPHGDSPDVAERTRERQYDRYRQEIQRRVQRVLVFPKVLALRLEQGETVVNFVVRPDGWIGDGPRIVKSSGFQEFDSEAVRAVLRAAPYPRRTDMYRVSMPVTFENPLIR